MQINAGKTRRKRLRRGVNNGNRHFAALNSGGDRHRHARRLRQQTRRLIRRNNQRRIGVRCFGQARMRRRAGQIKVVFGVAAAYRRNGQNCLRARRMPGHRHHPERRKAEVCQKQYRHSVAHRRRARVIVVGGNCQCQCAVRRCGSGENADAVNAKRRAINAAAGNIENKPVRAARCDISRHRRIVVCRRGGDARSRRQS